MEVVVLLIVLAVVALGVGAALFLRGRSAETDLEPPVPRDRLVVSEPQGRDLDAGSVDLLEPPVTAEPPPAGVETPVEVEAPPEVTPTLEEPPAVEAPPRFRDRLGKARSVFAGALGAIRGRSGIDQTVWDELEDALITADVGVSTAQDLLDALRLTVKEQGLTTGDQLLEALKAEMVTRVDGPVELAFSADPPSIWLFVGVNGVGKTTTIGKVGHSMAGAGHKVVMAAGDTFRAAAAEQLGTWAERAGAELVRGAEGGDPSAVIFDGVAHAAASGAGLVLADTAGRLHTKSNLMDELAKVRRVADKGAGTVTEVLLVLDATTGQNGLIQARQFTEAVDLTGVVLTKLDGSAKGGIVLAIRSQLGIPVKLVGLGEGAEDLVPFDAVEFVDALFDATGE